MEENEIQKENPEHAEIKHNKKTKCRKIEGILSVLFSLIHSTYIIFILQTYYNAKYMLSGSSLLKLCPLKFLSNHQKMTIRL